MREKCDKMGGWGGWGEALRGMTGWEISILGREKGGKKPTSVVVGVAASNESTH